MRRTDWSSVFYEFTESKRKEPFVWGKNDCCLFAADWYFACIGVDPAESFRGSYSSALQAAKLLSELGGLAALVDQHCERHLNPNFAMVGDIMLVTQEGRDMLVVCNGVTALGPGAEGLTSVSLEKALVAWKV